MAFFRKKAPPEPQTDITPEIAPENETAIPPTPAKEAGAEQNAVAAPDAATLIGGLGWYRAQYGRAMKLALVLVLALCLALAAVVFLVPARPTPRYFAATPDLRLAPLVPLDKPVLTQAGLLNWTTTTITGAVSLDFLEWRAKLTAARENFESDAFSSFVKALQTSGILDMIRDKRLSTSAVVTRAPVIIASGLVGGKSTWKIEFPLVVSYESSQGGGKAFPRKPNWT
jgi:intracellular multiplication protein IcmL